MTSLNGRATEDGVDLDSVFSALSHVSRRRLLIALAEDNPRRLHEFKHSDTEGEMKAMELYHCHLPKLDDAELIDWNRETGRIALGDHFSELRPLLEFMNDEWDCFDVEWRRL